MKIIIVGAGITGLSTYLFLKKLLPQQPEHTIKIYESHAPKPAATKSTEDDPFENIIGAGLGLNPNGVRVLRNLSPEIYKRFLDQGFQAKLFNFRTAGNYSLGEGPTIDGREPEEFCVATSRHGLQKVLMDAVDEGIVVYKIISRVKISDGGHEKPVACFVDGGEEEADLVIGADGVRSIVKKSLFGDDDEKKYAARYQGTSSVGGFITLPDGLPYDQKSMVFTMGPTGSFGYSGGSNRSPKQVMYWSSYESRDVPKKGEITTEDVRHLLRERHKHWKDPVIQYIIEKSTVDTIWPMWVTPSLPYWGRNGVLLMGDAAHAVTPNTGQGASMALQDAEMLATLIAKSLVKFEDEKKAIDISIAGLYDMRHAKLAEIQRRAINPKGSGAEPSKIKAMFMYTFMWLILNVKPLGQLMFGDAPKRLSQNADNEVEIYLSSKSEGARL